MAEKNLTRITSGALYARRYRIKKRIANLVALEEELHLEMMRRRNIRRPARGNKS